MSLAMCPATQSIHTAPSVCKSGDADSQGEPGDAFAPNSRFRARVTPARRGKGRAAAGDAQAAAANDHEDVATSAQRMTRAKQLRWIFRIDAETGPMCGGAARIIARIEDDEVIERILLHVHAQELHPVVTECAPSRASPHQESADYWR